MNGMDRLAAAERGSEDAFWALWDLAGSARWVIHLFAIFKKGTSSSSFISGVTQYLRFKEADLFYLRYLW